MSLQLALLNLVLRWYEKPRLARASDPVVERRHFERTAKRFFKMSDQIEMTQIVLRHAAQEVPSQWGVVREMDSDAPVLLYLHGGAYVLGSSHTHQALAGHLALAVGAQVCLPDYRRAPEHPHPAAPQDALATYQAILAMGHDPARIALVGDSAGGGLALSLLHQISMAELPQPACTVTFSPWVDLTLSGDSIHTNAAADPMLSAHQALRARDYYLPGQDATQATASPLFGQFDGAGPVLSQVGSTEILLDDARRMTDHLNSQGVRAMLKIWPRTPHVWQIFHDKVPEAKAALGEAADFLRQHLAT